jgi:elongation factor P
MYTTSDLKRGLILEFEGIPHVVEASSVSSPSARGGNTIHRVKMRNLKTRQRIEKSFRSGETFAVPDVDKRSVQYLYNDPNGYHFMDNESFEQFALTAEELGDDLYCLIEGLEGIRALYFNGAPIALELPNTVVLEIVETNPGVKGNSATGRTKPAKLETGLVVQVPEHIEQNIRVTIDTRTHEFLGRAKE